MSVLTLKEVVLKYNIAPTKKLGQNFLFDLNLTRKIASFAGDLTKNMIIEVGPGPGGLTRSIIERGAVHLVVIERDIRCIAALEELQSMHPGILHIINDDALTLKEEDIVSTKAKIIANLPYNIATTLLFKWLHKIELFESLTLMFQKEVAMRIAAKPRTKEYGRLSVAAQFLCDIEVNFDIPPTAFFPPPKVTSTVITLTPKKTPYLDVTFTEIENITKILFANRRKMLRSAMKTNFVNGEDILADAKIAGTRRAEELDIEDFCTIIKSINNLGVRVK